jgi:hypothetical protein
VTLEGCPLVPLAAEACEEKAWECLELAEKLTDPNYTRAMLQLAEWWMRLAALDRSIARIEESTDNLKHG